MTKVDKQLPTILDDLKVSVNDKNEIKRKADYRQMNNLLKVSMYKTNNPVLSTPKVRDYLKPNIVKILEYKNFPSDLKEIIYNLLVETANDNLYLCNKNIQNLKLKKVSDSKVALFNKSIVGSYNPKSNQIIYNDNNSFSHELLHMSSTTTLTNDFLNKKDVPVIFSGFERMYKNQEQFKGLNEGYTELLNRRKFFEGDYNTNSYSTNVYLLRILELLEENKEDFEKAYFYNNTEFVYNTFRKYGSSKEFFTLMTYLDFFSDTKPYIKEEVNEAIDLANEIINHTDDRSKIDSAQNITDEYFKNHPKMKIKKLY